MCHLLSLAPLHALPDGIFSDVVFSFDCRLFCVSLSSASAFVLLPVISNNAVCGLYFAKIVPSLLPCVAFLSPRQ